MFLFKWEKDKKAVELGEVRMWNCSEQPRLQPWCTVFGWT